MTEIVREVGQFPLSIGTSLALEGFFGIHPDQSPFPSGHKRINQVWINIRTLVRNFFSAMTSEVALVVAPQDAVPLLLQEIAVLPVIFSQSKSRKVIPQAYYNTLEAMAFDFPHAILRQPKTDKQRAFHYLENTTLKLLLLAIDQYKVPLTVYRSQPKDSPAVVALLTHHVHELLWRYRFDTLFLLESHTGKLKPSSMWHTKLHGIKDADRIPFNRLSLQLFGDSHVMEGQDKKIREEVKLIADDRRWTVITTLDKMKDDINRFGGESLKAICKDLRG